MSIVRHEYILLNINVPEEVVYTFTIYIYLIYVHKSKPIYYRRSKTIIYLFYYCILFIFFFCSTLYCHLLHVSSMSYLTYTPDAIYFT